MNQQAALSGERTKGGLIIYGLSVASGLANFLALKGLHHLVPSEELYSQLSLLLLSFTTFQILTDLGTHAQFLKSDSDVPAEQKQTLSLFLLQCRLALGAMACVISFFYSLSARFSNELTLAFLIYQLSLIPFAFMSTADSCFLASGQFAKAILSRVARLLGLCAFMGSVWLTEGKSLAVAATASTLTFVILAWFSWKAVFRPMMPLQRNFSFFSSGVLKNLGSTATEFLRGSAVAGIFILLQVAHSFFGQSYMVRSVGETNLASFNTSTAVATPAILAFQTLLQLKLPSVAKWSQKTELSFRKEFLQFSLVLLLMAVVMLGGLWLAHLTGTIVWLFPLGNEDVLALSQLQTSLHALLNMSAPLLLLGQYQGKGKVMLQWMVASILISWGIQFAFNAWSAQHAFLIGHIALAILLLAGSAVLLGLHKRTQVAE